MLRTGSNPPDINRIQSETGNIIIINITCKPEEDLASLNILIIRAILNAYKFKFGYFMYIEKKTFYIIWIQHFVTSHLVGRFFVSTKQVLLLMSLFYYSWKIVYNTIQYIFQYGLEPVLILIQQILIGFRAILEMKITWINLDISSNSDSVDSFSFSLLGEPNLKLLLAMPLLYLIVSNLYPYPIIWSFCL